jgi:hypothetical protein
LSAATLNEPIDDDGGEAGTMSLAIKSRPGADQYIL